MFKDFACQLIKSRRLGNVHLVYIYLVLHENKSMFISSVCQTNSVYVNPRPSTVYLSGMVRNRLPHEVSVEY